MFSRQIAGRTVLSACLAPFLLAAPERALGGPSDWLPLDVELSFSDCSTDPPRFLFRAPLQWHLDDAPAELVGAARRFLQEQYLARDRDLCLLREERLSFTPTFVRLVAVRNPGDDEVTGGSGFFLGRDGRLFDPQTQGEDAFAWFLADFGISPRSADEAIDVVKAYLALRGHEAVVVTSRAEFDAAAEKVVTACWGRGLSDEQRTEIRGWLQRVGPCIPTDMTPCVRQVGEGVHVEVFVAQCTPSVPALEKWTITMEEEYRFGLVREVLLGRVP